MITHPSGWRRTTIGELATVVRGASPRPKGDPRYFGGPIPWIAISDVTRQPGRLLTRTAEGVTPEGAQRSRLLPVGTLILTNSGTVGVPKVLGVEGCIHDGFVAFQGLSPEVDREFLYEFFRWQRPLLIEKHRQGVTQVNLNTEIVRNIEINLPPLDVQRRIVAKLDALLAQSRSAREQLEAVPALVETYRQSVLAAAFRGDLTADWRKKNPNVEPASKLLERIRLERRSAWEAAELAKMTAKGKPPKDDKWKSKYVEPDPVDTSELPELPPTWCWASVDQLATHVVDCLHRTPTYVQNGLPAIRTADIVRGRLLVDQARRVSRADYDEQTARLVPAAGDVLYSREGERFGLAALVPAGVELCISQRMMHFRTAPSVVHQFFMWALNSPLGYQQAVNDVGGSTSPHVNISSIRKFHLPLAPLVEQTELAVAIESAWAAITQLNSSANAVVESQVSEFERALLTRAFRGELDSSADHAARFNFGACAPPPL